MAKPALIKRAPFLCSIEVSYQRRNAPGENVCLTVRFAEDTLSFGPIKIRIALRQAYLNFALTNCVLPLAPAFENIWDNKVETLQKETRRTTTGENNSEATSSLAEASALPKASLSSRISTETGSKVENQLEIQLTAFKQHVFWRGNAKIPSLVFEAKPTHEFLRGTLLDNQVVGSLEPNSPAYGADLDLEIPKSGILIEHGEQFISYPNKRGLLKIIAGLALCSRARVHDSRFE